MKNRIVKIILLFAIMLTIFNNYNVEALTDPLTNPGHYDPGDGAKEVKLVQMGGHILGVINTVGVVVSVVVLMVVGIKYMLGSVEEKAEYKKTMSSYIIGAILLFGVTTIANILYTIAGKI